MAAKALTVRNISNSLATVVDWYNLGVHLGIPQHKLDVIRVNRNNDVGHCKFNLFDQWLRTDLDASWSQLATALDEAGEDKAAAVVREKYLGVVLVKAVKATNDCQEVCQPIQRAMLPPLAEQERAASLRDLQDAWTLIGSRQESGDDKLGKLIQGLVHWKFDVDYASPEQKGETLLHSAVRNVDMSSMKGLIAFGANVNLRNQFGQTPLDVAELSHQDELTGLLQSVGGVSGLQLTPLLPSAAILRDCPASPLRQNGPQRVLCLDCSDRMALLQLETLHQIERSTGKSVIDSFDWIVAGGTTAMLLMAMLYANKSSLDIRRLYFQMREKVFTQPTAVRRSEALHSLIHEVFDAQLVMNSIHKPNLLIAAVFKKTTKPELHLFNNCFRDDFSRVPVQKVACYTTASPLVFTEYDNYVDAGVVCGSLCSVAFHRIGDFYRDNMGGNQSIGTVVSVGPGQFPAAKLGSVDAQEYFTFGEHWTNPEEAVRQLSNLMSLYTGAAVSSGEEMVTSCRILCETMGVPFFRYNPIIDEGLPRSSQLNAPPLMECVIQTIIQVLGQQFNAMVHRLRSRSDSDPVGVGHVA